MRNKRFVALAWAVLFALMSIATALPARAEIAMAGTFRATSDCPALQAIHKQTNPGNVRLQPDHTYQILAANKQPPTHFLLDVPGATPQRRWVAVSCGTLAGPGTATQPAIVASPAPATPMARRAGPSHFVLAISWEPAFCASHGGKPECAAETTTGFDATHFTLHGLWPDPNEYCGVPGHEIATDKAGHWAQLPAVDLAPATRARLNQLMPGTRSLLERHEWLKHGTCTGVDADTYFGRATSFVEAINASPVQALFAANIGGSVRLDELRAAFDQALGKGAGQRIRLSCPRQDGVREITEITIGLEGDVTGTTPLATLVAAAHPTNGGCDIGRVTPVARR